MKQTVHNATYGEIVYEEGFWTGKKQISINGKPLTKISKTLFRLDGNEAITGNDGICAAESANVSNTGINWQPVEAPAAPAAAPVPEAPNVTTNNVANGAASNTDVTVKGNFLSGVKLEIGGQLIQVVPAVKWYEILLSIPAFILILIWGNSVLLCQIVPVVGGGIGGGISAVFCMINLVIIKRISPIWLKIVISVAMIGVTFGVCCGIGYAIVAAFS